MHPRASMLGNLHTWESIWNIRRRTLLAWQAYQQCLLFGSLVGKIRLESHPNLHQGSMVSTYSFWMHEPSAGAYAATLFLAVRSLVSVLVRLRWWW